MKQMSEKFVDKNKSLYVEGIEAFHFSISNELEQTIKHPTCVPDRQDHAANTLDLFFTSNPQNYTYTVSSLLGSSDHCTVSVTSSFTPPPAIPPTQRHLWHFENARCADMRNFLLDFPWNDYCFWTHDPDLAATAVGDVLDSGMRAYFPYSLITFSPSNLQFNRECSSAISDREGAHQSNQVSPFELTHATFISARNRCSAKIRRARSSFRKRKIDKLNSSPTEKCFWSLSKKIFNNFCNSGSRKIPPKKIPPRKFHPKKIPPKKFHPFFYEESLDSVQMLSKAQDLT